MEFSPMDSRSKEMIMSEINSALIRFVMGNNLTESSLVVYDCVTDSFSVGATDAAVYGPHIVYEYVSNIYMGKYDRFFF